MTEDITSVVDHNRAPYAEEQYENFFIEAEKGLDWIKKAYQ